MGKFDSASVIKQRRSEPVGTNAEISKGVTGVCSAAFTSTWPIFSEGDAALSAADARDATISRGLATAASRAGFVMFIIILEKQIQRIASE